MDLSSKQDLVIQFITLGMSKDRAYICASVSEEEQEIMDQDSFFVKRIAFNEANEERLLLEKFHKCMDISAANGKSDDIKWKLALINRDRYGSGVSSADDGKRKFKMNFNFKEGTASLESDNLEVGGFNGNSAGIEDNTGLEK